jgi:hypothetical protein
VADTCFEVSALWSDSLVSSFEIVTFLVPSVTKRNNFIFKEALAVTVANFSKFYAFQNADMPVLMRLCLLNKRILGVMSTRTFRKTAVLKTNCQRQENLLPPQGKVAIVPRQHKVLHVGRGVPLTNCAPSSKLSRANLHTTCCRPHLLPTQM